LVYILLGGAVSCAKETPKVPPDKGGFFMEFMKIIQANIYHVRLPMKVSFKTAFGEINQRDTIIVELMTNDGIIGYGESAALSAPIYLSETIKTCMHIIQDFLLPHLLNRDISVEEYVETTAYIRGNQIAKFGVECALFDIQSQYLKKSISQCIGGVRKEIAVGKSIGIQPTIEKTIEQIEQYVKEGYVRMKLKIKPGNDIELIKQIRKRFPDIELTVDANSSYTLRDVNVFKKLDEYNLAMIEQPLAYNDIIDHASLQKNIHTPICLDESILSAEDARKAIEIGACRIINVKPGRVGGLIETMKINTVAKTAGIPLWCGGMLESGIAKAYNIAAASLSEFSYPADISPTDEFYTGGITSPDIQVNKSGMLTVPSHIGRGYTVDIEAIHTYSVHEIHI
jgi:o-succinylbenzoate synthase